MVHWEWTSTLKDFPLKFVVISVNGQTITNAKIHLYNAGIALEVRQYLKPPKAETSITSAMIHGRKEPWNNRPASDLTELASVRAVSDNTWCKVDLACLQWRWERRREHIQPFDAFDRAGYNDNLLR